MSIGASPAMAAGGLLLMEYGDPSVDARHSLFMHLAHFDAASFSYTGGGPKAPLEPDVPTTFAALAALWAPYYPATWTLRPIALYYSDGGAYTEVAPLPAWPAVAGTDGPESVVGPTVQRILHLRSVAGDKRRLHLHDMAGTLVDTSATLNAMGGGLDARDVAMLAYLSGAETGAVAPDGFAFAPEARAEARCDRAWELIPPGVGAGALLWDRDRATWTYAALDDVFALLSADIADASHGPYLRLTQGGHLRFQLDPVSGLYLAVTFHDDGTFDGSGATIEGGLHVTNSLARLSHQKSILQLVDLNTLEAVDQMIANGAFYLIGPHNRPNTDYQLDSGGTLEWTGASHPPTGVLALDSGEDVNHRAVRLGVLNATDGPDNDVLWALCANTYGGLTTPALDAHPGQLLGYIPPLAPDTNPRLAPIDATTPADILTPVPVPTATTETCVQMRCGVSLNCTNHLVSLYDNWARWLNPLFAVAGALAFAALLEELSAAILEAEVAESTAAIWSQFKPLVQGAFGVLSGNLLPFLIPDTRSDVQKMLFCALSCEGGEVILTKAQIDAWHTAQVAYGDWAAASLQGQLVQLLTQYTPLQDWLTAASTASPSGACDLWTCP